MSQESIAGKHKNRAFRSVLFYHFHLSPPQNFLEVFIASFMYTVVMVAAQRAYSKGQSVIRGALAVCAVFFGFIALFFTATPKLWSQGGSHVFVPDTAHADVPGGACGGCGGGCSGAGCGSGCGAGCGAGDCGTCDAGGAGGGSCGCAAG